MNRQSTLPALLLLSAALAPAVPAIALIENPAPMVSSQPVTAQARQDRHGHRLLAMARDVYRWSSEKMRSMHRQTGSSPQGRDAGASA